MKCSIVRDLLPLYDIKKCRKETRIIVSDHLEKCKSCREIYQTMHSEVGLKDSIEVEQKPDDDKEFWSKYYGTLLLKGLLIFFLVYGFVIGIKAIIG